MTRKRFVKLLMADGYSRNHANSIARDTSAEGWSYSLKYYCLQIVKSCPDIVDMTIDGIKKTVDMIVDIIPSVVQAVMNLIAAAFEVAQSVKALEKELEVNHE